MESIKIFSLFLSGNNTSLCIGETEGARIENEKKEADGIIIILLS